MINDLMLISESYYRVAHPKSFDGGLHGYFARYGPYDSQEWWPEADDWPKDWLTILFPKMYDTHTH